MLPHSSALGSPRLVGRSAALLRVHDAIEKIARAARTTVLVTGETGTGKELVARAIHERSRRASAPFVAVNCAALTAELVGAELFGYVPGAFTGALPRGRDGLLAAAEGGTLLLDEIGELDAAAQAQLLRVLQERAFRPVGGHADRAMDVRIIAATHRDLQQLVTAGRFRADLWYRLNVASVHLPALRQRREDIPELVQHLAARIAHESAAGTITIAPEALDELVRRDWPGNVRELGHVLERAAIDAQGARIELEHLGPADAARADAGAPTVLEVDGLSIAAVERCLIARVLAETCGNRTRAAERLGIHRATLHSKLRAHGLPARAG